MTPEDLAKFFGIKLLPYQEEYLKCLQLNKPFCFVWPRRAGKTYTETVYFMYNEMIKEVMELQKEATDLAEDNKILRRQLAYAYSGTRLYADDGELQDQEIDHKRDSVAEIEQKITKRGELAAQKYFNDIKVGSMPINVHEDRITEIGMALSCDMPKTNPYKKGSIEYEIYELRAELAELDRNTSIL